MGLFGGFDALPKVHAATTARSLVKEKRNALSSRLTQVRREAHRGACHVRNLYAVMDGTCLSSGWDVIQQDMAHGPL